MAVHPPGAGPWDWRAGDVAVGFTGPFEGAARPVGGAGVQARVFAIRDAHAGAAEGSRGGGAGAEGGAPVGGATLRGGAGAVQLLDRARWPVVCARALRAAVARGAWLGLLFFAATGASD